MPNPDLFTLPKFSRLVERVSATTPGVVVSEMDDETKVLARMGERAPRLHWSDFYNAFNWKPGEHVTMIGPTGEGKTTAMLGILPKRKYRVVLGTKPADATLDDLLKPKNGYVKMERWRAADPDDFPRRLLWPNARDINATDTQREVFRDALSRIFREGGWCVAADELGYLSEMLGLKREIKLFLIQGRSLGLSLISATQRPAWVPLEVYNQATHLFLWKTQLQEDVQRLSNLNGTVDPREIASYLARLERYQFLYVNTRTGAMYRTRAPEIKDVI